MNTKAQGTQANKHKRQCLRCRWKEGKNLNQKEMEKGKGFKR